MWYIMKFIDLKGKTFSRLTVIKRRGAYKNHAYKDFKWLCKCVCGKLVVARGSRLRGGLKRSCGCLHHEWAKTLGKNTKPGVPIRALFTRYKYAATKRKLSFVLSFEQFLQIIKRPCFYCGAENSNHFHTPEGPEELRYNGIDRMNNREGYTYLNSVPCCGVCNRMKSAFTVAQFFSFIERIYGTLLAKTKIDNLTVAGHCCK